MKLNEATSGRSAADNQAEKRAKNRRTRLIQDGFGAFFIALFLFFGATAREVNLLLALGALVGGFVALDYFWGRRTLRRLRVSRKISDAVYAGERFDVSIEICNESKRAASWAVAVEDRWAPESPEFFAPESVRNAAAKTADAESTPEKNAAFDGKIARATLRPVAYFPQIRAGETRKVRYSGVLTRRGLRRLETLTVSTRFPLGFYRSSERFDAPAEVLVLPKIGILTDAWDAFAGDSARDATVATGRSSRIPDETLTVRDWRSGDPKKAIHWRATAKRDRLQTRDFEERKARTIFLLLDLFDPSLRDSNVKLGGSDKSGAANDAFRRWENAELAVSFAATLAERWARSDDANFFFALNGDETLAPGGGSNVEARAPFWSAPSGGSARETAARLATAQRSGDDRLPEILAEIDSRTFGEAQIFVVSPEPFDFERLNRGDFNDLNASWAAKDAKNGEIGENEPIRRGGRTARLGQNALFVDASSAEFSTFFEI